MSNNQIERAITSVKKLMDKFADWGLTAGFVFTTDQGFVKFYGSEAVGAVIDQYRDSIIKHPAFSHQQTAEKEPEFLQTDAGKMVNITF